MDVRRVRRLAMTTCCVALCGLSVFSVHAALQRSTPTARAAISGPAGGGPLARPRILPAMALRAASGRAISTRSWRGRWVVLAPSMTLCHEVCPMTTAALTELQRALDAAGLSRRVEVAEASVDPWRDSPARLRAYRRLTGAPFTLLTGSRHELHRLWHWLGVFYQRVAQGHPADIDWMTHRPERFDVQHTDAVFIFDPAGRERVAISGMAGVGGHLPARLRGLLNDQGRANLRQPQMPWTADQLLGDLETLMAEASPGAPSGGRSATLSAPSPALARRALRGSPPALAALHAQAGELLGSQAALARRLAALRGHPVVLNAWASWCDACRAEFGLLGAVAAREGRRVAFLGVDVNDDPGSARAFLAAHPVSYPSYRSDSTQLPGLALLEGLPTTLLIGPEGRVRDVHTGQYATAGALEAEIAHSLTPGVSG